MCAAAVDFGLGLRHEHYEEIAANPGRVSWLEAPSENYMVPGGSPMHWPDRRGCHIVDAHDHPIVPDIWTLYAEAVRLFPGVPTKIEHDADIPPYELLTELDVARGIGADVGREAEV